MNIGETLKGIRKNKNLTQMQVTKKMKISQTYLSQLESDSKEPSPEMLRKLCKFYGVPHQAVVWKSIEEKDIQPNKKKIYRQLKPAMDGLIDEILKTN